ncbi:MAG: response regulator [Hymenobacteraceae bacterium]|nr:response regulator [Hymenobacteraceae bacterium]MDX5396579.1 response regulator [Hymenobacteraceae bacterium]MDX5512642.1 response regulator [Hymenobacteraceae bacterium]
MCIFDQVLLIDDDAVSSFITERIILDEGFANDVVHFMMAEDALDYLHKLQLQDTASCAIFLDISMPFMSGWDFIEEFKKLPEALRLQCKIYMLSGAVDVTELKCAQCHPLISEFITKPLTREDLEVIKENLKLQIANGALAPTEEQKLCKIPNCLRCLN